MIKFYNTLFRKKKTFESIDKKNVKIYTCGPTVYNYAHIGNLSAYLFVDLLKRYLRFKGYNIIDVMNITDVDDKTIKHSQEKNQSLKEYTNFYTKALFEDFNKLNILIPKTICRATDYIDEMIKLIKALIDKGCAYKAEDESVYFKISKFKNYGKLSNLQKRELKSGASGRVNLDEYNKENISDFVLWKAWNKKDGNNFWQSPFGKGRPGWHIECSAMSMKNLGTTLDIHTGAVDLIFPHHENEIAQSEACTNKPFVNYWLHRGYLKVDDKKMSKSLGNFYTLKDILKQVSNPMAFRYLILTSHYRSNLNFTFEGLKSAEKSLFKIQNFIERIKEQNSSNGEDNALIKKYIHKTRKEFIISMDDDLNTPQAIASIHKFITDINKILDTEKISSNNTNDIIKFFEEIDSIFGCIFHKTAKINGDKKNKIEKLIKTRNDFRINKEWGKADEIKEELLKMGIGIKDEKDGTKWYIN